VLDNLNIHTTASLYAAFSPAEVSPDQAGQASVQFELRDRPRQASHATCTRRGANSS
jgi:hypothetical protein